MLLAHIHIMFIYANFSVLKNNHYIISCSAQIGYNLVFDQTVSTLNTHRSEANIFRWIFQQMSKHDNMPESIFFIADE